MLEAAQIEQLFGIDTIIFYKNGCEIIRKPRSQGPKNKPPARKGIFEMSKKSKMRLTHIVANCDIGFNSMFTLTYGDFFRPLNGKILKKHLETLLNSLRKRYKAEYVWFVEFTKRDRPHIHVITTINPNQFDREWLGHRWATITVVNYYKRIVAHPEEFKVTLEVPLEEWVMLDEAVKVMNVHRHAKCWEKIRLEDGAMRYCFKYATKSEQKIVPPGFHSIGRFWGTSKGVQPKPQLILYVGKDLTEEEAKAIFQDHRVGDLPLLPKYILEKDALEYFRINGQKLSKIIEIPD